jgi:hypothetical protein
MKKMSYRTFNKAIVADLTEKFLNGDLFTLDQIAENYLGRGETAFIRIMNKRRVVGFIKTIKSHLKKDGDIVACVDTNEDGKGVFGIVNREAQARYAMSRYYVITKGILAGAMALQQNVRAKGLLRGKTTTEILSLPKIKE